MPLELVVVPAGDVAVVAVVEVDNAAVVQAGVEVVVAAGVEVAAARAQAEQQLLCLQPTQPLLRRQLLLQPPELRC